MLIIKPEWEYEVVGNRCHYLVRARTAETAVGLAYGWYEPTGPFVVEKIEIEPSHRSLGYGRRIIECLREKARERGCREFVFKGVRLDNDGAMRLYESLGAAVGTVRDGLVSYVLSPP